MDALDIKIVRELGGGGARPYDAFSTRIRSLREVALRLDISKDTVRDRISKLKKDGSFLGWSTVINPNLLSLRVVRTWLQFRDFDTKEKAIQSLSEFNPIRTTTDYFGDFASFVIALDDAQGRDSVLREIHDRIGPFKEQLTATIRFPACKARLNSKDMRIYKTVRDRSQLPQTQISDEADLPLRTTKRRLKRLKDKNAYLLVSHWNPGRLDGTLAELLVASNSPNLIREATLNIASEFDDILLSAERHEEPVVAFVLMSNKVSSFYEAFQFAKHISGVSQCQLYLVRDFARVGARLDLGSHEPAAV